MPEWAAGLSERRDRKKEVDMMSNCQPSLRAIASAFGTFGVSMKPNRKTHARKCFSDRLDANPFSGVNARRVGGFDGQNDVLLVQHLVMFEAME